MVLLELPPRDYLLIFCHSPTARDALAVASTCVFLRRLFRQGNKLRILLPILEIPREIPFDVAKEIKQCIFKARMPAILDPWVFVCLTPQGQIHCERG
jgi:hypothetical protein